MAILQALSFAFHALYAQKQSAARLFCIPLRAKTNSPMETKLRSTFLNTPNYGFALNDKPVIQKCSQEIKSQSPGS
jgi:hypothetical protein